MPIPRATTTPSDSSSYPLSRSNRVFFSIASSLAYVATANTAKVAAAALTWVVWHSGSNSGHVHMHHLYPGSEAPGRVRNMPNVSDYHCGIKHKPFAIWHGNLALCACNRHGTRAGAWRPAAKPWTTPIPTDMSCNRSCTDFHRAISSLPHVEARSFIRGNPTSVAQ